MPIWKKVRHLIPGASLVAQLVKNLPAMRETWVLSLGWEDPLEKGTTTHSSILAWRIQQTEELGRLQFKGCRVGHDCSRHTGEGYGTPLQYFCLENPMDRGAWWAAVHGVARVGHN